MNVFGFEVTRIAVVSAVVGAMFVGVGITLASEVLKSVWTVLFKRRFERWLRRFDHHRSRIIRRLYAKNHK